MNRLAILLWCFAAACRAENAASVAAPATRPAATRPAATQPFVDRWVTPPTRPNPLLTHHTFKSAALAGPVGYNLYLPPGYDRGAERYPVIYWLHGMGQSESQDQYPIALLDEAIRAARLPPMIVVYASGGQRTFYTDSPDGRVPAETIVVRELIPHIDSTCRTLADRRGRVIQGMSMGGFGSLKLAFKYPDLFCGVVAFAPAIRTPEMFVKERAEILQRMYGNDLARYAADEPVALLKKNLRQISGAMAIDIHIGTRDYLLPGNRWMKRTLDELKVESRYEEIDDIDHNLGKLARHCGLGPFEFAARCFKAIPAR